MLINNKARIITQVVEYILSTPEALRSPAHKDPENH